MPAPGVPNNPNGVNSFSGLQSEPMYGEATKVASLQRGAPMAGAPVAAGAIAAPKRATRRAAGARPQSAAAPSVVGAPAPPQTPSYNASLALQWQAIAAIPGASPLVQEYAALAQRNPGG